MSQTIQLRQKNPDEEEKMAQFESPNGDDVCASYIARAVAEQLGEFAALTISEDADVMAELDGVSGSGEGNYGIYETPSGAVTGLYVSHDALSEVTGDDPTPENAPESLGLTFAPSTEDEWEESVEEEETVDEDEVDGLLADDESDDEEEVEISDEELDLVDA